jgi:hypothetical protein
MDDRRPSRLHRLDTRMWTTPRAGYPEEPGSGRFLAPIAPQQPRPSCDRMAPAPYHTRLPKSTKIDGLTVRYDPCPTPAKWGVDRAQTIEPVHRRIPGPKRLKTAPSAKSCLSPYVARGTLLIALRPPSCQT